MGKPEKMFERSESGNGSALRQCEILSGLIVYEIAIESIAINTVNIDDHRPASLEATPIVHPFAIVVSQDCDLTQDYNFRHNNVGKPRNSVSSILFCEAMEADELVHGEEHGSVFAEGAIRQDYRNNNDFRFHFIQEIPREFDSLGCGLPELGFVFKRFFSIPTKAAYDQVELGYAQRRSVLKSPYVEHFCDRFYHYNNRIALPEQYEST